MKNQRNGLLQPDKKSAVIGDSCAGAGGRFCCKVSMSVSSSAEIEGLSEL